ncbi:hypothetical protein [Dehalococcoides mccartyi]|uniref:Uncharacterized protein n=1 Tax=Dehalococcoides mccartyi TaxID=61435 RepID=A0AB33HN13_9CHLR|nr:hypothetical protein [Dehalococcoides mccartyi]BAS31170.1 hypothetical protein IBK_0095 [Dehalococcoides mccartyi IBARAKI]BAZ96699.1 hypothetical protein DEHALATV1_0071 [Dehalococcoides mccartyi]
MVNILKKAESQTTTAVVIDPIIGWKQQSVPIADIPHNARKVLFKDHWMYLVIKQTSSDGAVSYIEPELPKTIKTLPSSLYRGLKAFSPQVKPIWGGNSDVWKKLKIGAMWALFAAIAFLVVIIFSSSIGA